MVLRTTGTLECLPRVPVDVEFSWRVEVLGLGVLEMMRGLRSELGSSEKLWPVMLPELAVLEEVVLDMDAEE
jgi:hypothetical protein